MLKACFTPHPEISLIMPEVAFSATAPGVVGVISAIAAACFGTWATSTCATLGILSGSLALGGCTGKIGLIALPLIFGPGIFIGAQGAL